mmetsp:Transcript_34488/g.55810  ORF Transcript_34488/g.55810 Transcript_34488/m.55810 type:complete len:83 (-) Transcript_34488:400-648(-)
MCEKTTDTLCRVRLVIVTAAARAQIQEATMELVCFVRDSSATTRWQDQVLSQGQGQDQESCSGLELKVTAAAVVDVCSVMNQ